MIIGIDGNQAQGAKAMESSESECNRCFGEETEVSRTDFGTPTDSRGEPVENKNGSQCLIQAAAQEIATFRGQQMSRFREAVIVMGLVVWGTHTFTDGETGWAIVVIRVLAATSCLLVGLLAGWIIMADKRRIHWARTSRESAIMDLIKRDGLSCSKARTPFFYPVDFKDANGTKKHRGIADLPTSGVYMTALLVIALLTAAFNILANF